MRIKISPRFISFDQSKCDDIRFKRNFKVLAYSIDVSLHHWCGFRVEEHVCFQSKYRCHQRTPVGRGNGRSLLLLPRSIVVSNSLGIYNLLQIYSIQWNTILQSSKRRKNIWIGSFLRERHTWRIQVRHAIRSPPFTHARRHTRLKEYETKQRINSWDITIYIYIYISLLN